LAVATSVFQKHAFETSLRSWVHWDNY